MSQFCGIQPPISWSKQWVLFFHSAIDKMHAVMKPTERLAFVILFDWPNSLCGWVDMELADTNRNSRRNDSEIKMSWGTLFYRPIGMLPSEKH